MSASADDQAVQNPLADVFAAAPSGRCLHGRAVPTRTTRPRGRGQQLVEDARRNVAAASISQSLIATAAGVAQPRVSKITSEASAQTPAALGRQLRLISEWPLDALKSPADGFA